MNLFRLDTISVISLDNKHKNRYRKTLITENLDEPRAIAVDPRLGLIFWTDWGKNAKIERSGMDGNNRQVIVTGKI